jgi:hypothetical protein
MKESKFEEKVCNSPLIVSAYQHIDNGGHTIMVDEYYNLHISTGFFGYSQTSVMLSRIDLDGLIETLQKAKRRLEELATIRKLKGE